MWRHDEGLVTLCPLPSTNAFQYQASIAPGQDPRRRPREHAGDPRPADRPHRHPPARAGVGGHFTVLDFGTSTEFEFPSHVRTLHVVGQPAGPDDVADTRGHLAGAYGTAERTLVLIRPDGYVALISDAGDVSMVSDQLAAIF